MRNCPCRVSTPASSPNVEKTGAAARAPGVALKGYIQRSLEGWANSCWNSAPNPVSTPSVMPATRRPLFMASLSESHSQACDAEQHQGPCGRLGNHAPGQRVQRDGIQTQTAAVRDEPDLKRGGPRVGEIPFPEDDTEAPGWCPGLFPSGTSSRVAYPLRHRKPVGRTRSRVLRRGSVPGTRRARRDPVTIASG